MKLLTKSVGLLFILLVAPISAQAFFIGPKLIGAANSGKYDKVVMLVEQKNHDINILDRTGNTPLIHAAWKGHNKIVKYLISKGADVNHQEQTSAQAAIHIATVFNNIDVIKTLVEAGADINIQKTNGSTAVLIAAVNKRVDIAEYLISKGADLTIANNEGTTPLSHAKDQNDQQMIALLNKHDAPMGETVVKAPPPQSAPARTEGGVDSEALARREYENYKCPAKTITGIVGEDRKSLEYVVEGTYKKAWPEPACIENITVTDIIKLRGNKIIKYDVTFVFPFGNRLECERIRKRKEENERRGVLDPRGQLSMMTDCMGGWGSRGNPLAYGAERGERRAVSGEAEI